MERLDLRVLLAATIQTADEDHDIPDGYSDGVDHDRVSDWSLWIADKAIEAIDRHRSAAPVGEDMLEAARKCVEVGFWLTPEEGEPTAEDWIQKIAAFGTSIRLETLEKAAKVAEATWSQTNESERGLAAQLAAAIRALAK